MTANKAEITSIVTYIAKEAEKRNGSQKKAVNQQLIIEKTKQLVWFLGISYVTIALSLFFEGLS